MPSTIGWLDTTAEQQRIAREMVSLFMLSESRDELGIGQIRDVLSNWMFPGTSVLQTRARYFVLIPWCYEVAERRARRSAKDLEQHVREVQREMIESMRRDFPDEDGLIGKQAGRALKGLPRDLFWSGLVAFGIRRTEIDVPPPTTQDEGEVSELADRQPTAWDPDLPDRPRDFPGFVPHGLEMSGKEAEWLSERMRTGHEDTYLAHLLELDPRVLQPAMAPWEVPTTRRFTSVEHARCFSLLMEGASLLYNLLVAERYASHPDLNRLDGSERIQHFEDELQRWAVQAVAADLMTWDFDGFRGHVATINRRISRRTWSFVEEWLDIVRRLGPSAVTPSAEARRHVEARERRKGNKSRLGSNPKMLESWNGDSGSGALLYRWSNISRLVQDINGGRGTQETSLADA